MSNQQNFQKFDFDLKEFAQVLQLDFLLVLKKVIFQLFRAIILHTPVDTGRAASSWAMSKHNPGDFVWPPIDKKTQASPAAAAGNAMQNIVPVDDVNSVYYIYNNVEYILELENGKSRQAPAGMVAVSLAEVETNLATFMYTGVEVM